MRIIGGKYRSRVLASFDGDAVRPTSDRAKEALFNMLAFKMIGARVLDLFSGSGALGLESLSRGAKDVVFNDLSKDSVALLKKNMKTLKIAENSGEVKVYNFDYLTCLNAVKGQFDVILIDPPYRLDYGIPALQAIVKNRLLSEDGIVVYERDRAFDGEVDGLEQYDERKYGKTYFTFFKTATQG